MNKTEQYFKTTQEIALSNQGNLVEYLSEIDKFRSTQQFLKRNKLKTRVEFVIVYFIEYINTGFEREFLNRTGEQDIYTFITHKISREILPLRDICVDEVTRKVLLSKKDAINDIIVDNYIPKRDKILQMRREIEELQKGMI